MNAPHVRAAMAGVPLTAPMIKGMGTIRLMRLTEKYGVESSTVMHHLVMWGELLDSVNHPPAECKNCHEPVVYDSQRAFYVHSGRPTTSDRYCLLSAGSIAERPL